MTETVIVKKLSELLVKDLRAELEKRGLDHKGVKAVLLERLQEALLENGEDPENLMFETCISPRAKTAREETQVEETEGDEEDAYDEEDEAEEEILEEEDDIVMELIEDSDDANPEEEDIYGDLVADMQEDMDEVNEEDVFNLNMENEQMVTNEEEEEDQEEDVEEIIEEDDGIEGAELITEEDVADPTSATNAENEDESMVEPVNDNRVTDKQGKAGNQSPEKRMTKPQAAGVDSTTREDKKGHGEKADKSKAESSDKNLKNSTKESKVNEAKTDPTGKINRESSSEKKPTPTSGSETSPIKSSTSAGTTSSKDDKDSKGSKKSASANSNLWVSGLSKETRAADLKSAFSKYGKVIGAKIIWNAKLPGHHCFGFLSMSSNPEAANAIKQLNHTVLHGRTIDVTWARNQTPTPLNQKSSSTSSSSSTTPATAKKETKETPAVDSNKPAPKPVAKETKETKDTSEKKDEKATPAKVEKTVAKKDDTPGKKDEGKSDKSSSSTSSTQGKNVKQPLINKDSTKKTETPPVRKDSQRSGSRSDTEKTKSVLSLNEIKEKQRREDNKKRKEREARAEDRRRDREREDRYKREREDIQRKFREEARKIRKERELLQIEQAKLEKERSERIRIEKERIKLQQDREKFQKELEEHRKMELQLRQEQEQQVALKRSLETSGLAQQDLASYGGEHKRRAMMAEAMVGNFNNPPTDTRLVVSVGGERHVEKYDQRDHLQGATTGQNIMKQLGFSGSPQDLVQTAFGGAQHDSSSTSQFIDSSNQRRDDRARNDEIRRFDSDRRENDRSNSRQRSINRNDDPPRRDEGSRRRGDGYRRDDGYKRVDEPARRLESSQSSVSRQDSRRDQDRNERKTSSGSQSDRYQGSTRGGDSSYSQRENRDYRDTRDKPRDAGSMRISSHSSNSRDSWKGGAVGTSGSSWKADVSVGDNQNLDRNQTTNQFGSFQQQQQQKTGFQAQTAMQTSMPNTNMRMSGSTSLLGRGDFLMNQQQEPLQIRGSILGNPPSQESASWPPSNLDPPMSRGSGSLNMSAAAPIISNLMNQSQPMASIMTNPSMTNQLLSGGLVSGGNTGGLMGNISTSLMGSVSSGLGTVSGGLGRVSGGLGGGLSGGLGGNMGLIPQVGMGTSSFMGTQMQTSGAGSSVGLDRFQQMQTDNRFNQRRF